MRFQVIGYLFALAFLAACNRPVETQNFASLPHVDPALQAIDSLTWQQPDSALAVLLDYFARRDALNASPNASPKNDINDSIPRRNHCLSTTYNRHYAHLLLAELLYKNGYAQTNRTELRQAVAYFDSLAFALNDAPTPRSRHCGLDPQSPNSCDPFFFLAARAHYINGVGYYENDSTVEACQQYLKALDVMERHFEEKDLVGNKARFMALTYNRLGDMFSEQYMMRSAITCYKKALNYCKIEPTSPRGVSNILFRLGLQYDKLDDKDSMIYYYDKAIEAMPTKDNVNYRDVTTLKALAEYQLGSEAEHVLQQLRMILSKSTDEDERLTRFLTLGNVYFEERIFDSALFYLESVFKNSSDMVSKIQASEFLRIIYDSLGNTVGLNDCLLFLAQYKKSEGQNKALVSQLDNLFLSHTKWLQDKHDSEERQNTIINVFGITIPIVSVIGLLVLLALRHANRKKWTAAIESERDLHRAQQAAIAGKLRKRNEEVVELKKQINQQKDNIANKELPKTIDFLDEPICQIILGRVNEGHFLSQMDCTIYKDYALEKNHVLALRNATDQHFNHFTVRLAKSYSMLTKTDIDYCCLYLLGLSDSDVAALMQRAYNTVNERSNKLRRIFGNENTLTSVLQAFAKGYTSY